MCMPYDLVIPILMIISIFQRKMCERTELFEVKLGKWLGKLVVGGEWSFIYTLYIHCYISEFLNKNKLMQYLEKISVKKKKLWHWLYLLNENWNKSVTCGPACPSVFATEQTISDNEHLEQKLPLKRLEQDYLSSVFTS